MEFNISFKTGKNKLITKAVNFSQSFLNYINGSSVLGTSNKELKQTLETIPDIYTITDYTASVISNLPLKFTKPSGAKSNNEDLKKLFSTPNYYQSWKEFVKTYFYYYEIFGNAFVYFIKPNGMQTISEMYLLPVEFTGVVLKYDNKLPDWGNQVIGYKVTINGQDIVLSVDDVLHNRYPTLKYVQGSYIWGMSKYIPGNKNANELEAIYDAKTSIISNRGALGIFSNESNFPNSEESKNVQDKLGSIYGLGSDQKKFIVTTEKLVYQQIAMNLQELQLIENNKLSFEKICQLNGYDAVIWSTEGSTFSNKEQAKIAAIKDVIKPKADDFYSNINSFIAPYFDGHKVEPDWDKVSELQPNYEALVKIYSMAVENMIITPMEAQKRVFGDTLQSNNLPPDEYYKKSSLVPAIQPEPIEEESQTGQDMPEITPEQLQELINTNGNGTND